MSVWATASDVVYDSALHEPLVAALKHLVDTSTRVLIGKPPTWQTMSHPALTIILTISTGYKARGTHVERLFFDGVLATNGFTVKV